LTDVFDYGRPIEFGIGLSPDVAVRESAVTMALAADRSGFDLVGIQDHPYQSRFVDTMTLIGVLLAGTERVRVFPDVACLPLRPPAMLAKEAASLDVLSGGRFELGLGAGAFWDAIAAMDGPRLTPGEAVDALEEAIAIIRAAWRGESTRLSGAHYGTAGYRPGPLPSHPIEIWLGAYKPRMLWLTGSKADGWLPSLGRLSPDQIKDGHRVIDEAAEAVDRSPREIRRLVNLGADAMDGSEDQQTRLLATLATEYGIDTFLMAPPGSDPSAIERFGNRVIPLVRDEIDRRRSEP
jgi:alkanesulfonate monooxygenase SsuD/methylene tetrahydromethanopterin reductase-like flavin-dependent oxidoreductase (luciferase family)